MVWEIMEIVAVAAAVPIFLIIFWRKRPNNGSGKEILDKKIESVVKDLIVLETLTNVIEILAGNNRPSNNQNPAD